MDYCNAVSGTAEKAPRSEHHAAMLVLEQRTAQLQKSIEALALRLEPAIRSSVPEPGGANAAMSESTSPGAQIVAHVHSVLRVVENCIQRVETLDDRLVI